MSQTILPLTIEINDQAVLRKVHSLAKRKKTHDIPRFIQGIAMQAIMGALGITADLSPGEVAMRLGCHLNTVKNYMKTGVFPGLYYRSARCARIPQKDVDAMKGRTAKAA